VQVGEVQVCERRSDQSCCYIWLACRLSKLKWTEDQPMQVVTPTLSSMHLHGT
jgi:hypothetical protein